MAACEGGVRGLRLGMPREYFVDGMHPEVAARVREGVLVLGSRHFEGPVPLRSRFGNTLTRVAFRLATGVRVMKRAIPLWRAKVAELGDDPGSVEWAREELQRYHCPACGKPLFRGAKRCRACKEPVAETLDGTL